MGSFISSSKNQVSVLPLEDKRLLEEEAKDAFHDEQHVRHRDSKDGLARFMPTFTHKTRTKKLSMKVRAVSKIRLSSPKQSVQDDEKKPAPKPARPKNYLEMFKKQWGELEEKILYAQLGQEVEEEFATYRPMVTLALSLSPSVSPVCPSDCLPPYTHTHALTHANTWVRARAHTHTHTHQGYPGAFCSTYPGVYNVHLERVRQ